MKSLNFKNLMMLSIVFVSSSCSMLLPDRSFIAEMERESDGFYNPGKDFPVVSGDTGAVGRSREEVKLRTPSSERAKKLNTEALSLSDELKQKEEALFQGINEPLKEKYSLDKKFLQTDSDKLYYLSLSTPERETYIESKKLDLKEDLEQKTNMVKRRSVHSSELFLGMNKNEVVEMWGKPARVEIAGNPSHQNERWSFLEDGSVKQVYFEEGKVQGWALDL